MLNEKDQKTRLKVINLLEDIIMNNPEMRVGQIVSNALCEFGDIFYVPDSEYLTALKDYETKCRRRRFRTTPNGVKIDKK